MKGVTAIAVESLFVEKSRMRKYCAQRTYRSSFVFGHVTLPAPGTVIFLALLFAKILSIYMYTRIKFHNVQYATIQ